MRTFRLLILFSHILLITCLSSNAQPDTKSVSVELKEASIDSLVHELEMQTGYHFYYDPVQFDSLQVSLSVTSISLHKVLELVFANSDYHFAIPEKQPYVLLTKGAIIKTTLPPGFFSGTTVDSLQGAISGYGDKKKTRTGKKKKKNSETGAKRLIRPASGPGCNLSGMTMAIW